MNKNTCLKFFPQNLIHFLKNCEKQKCLNRFAIFSIFTFLKQFWQKGMSLLFSTEFFSDS
jgi:hypothetical protein